MSVEVEQAIEDACDLGKRLLSELLTPELTKTHLGKVVAIDVDSKEFVFGTSVVDCRKRMKSPIGARVYATRVGDTVLHRFGYSKRVEST